MNNLNTPKTKSRSSMFLFFVIGLFMLQIAFAFTIHGDIGPQTDLLPMLSKPASPILIGRIDSLVSRPKVVNPIKVAPEGAFSPASKKIHNFFPAVVDSEIFTPNRSSKVTKTDNHRLCEYRIQSGDTLQKISKHLYGNTKKVQAIVRLNRVVNERALRVGSTLLVPHAGLLKSIQIL